MTSTTRGGQAEMGQKRHWAVGGPVDLVQNVGGSRPRWTRHHSPSVKTSEVRKTPPNSPFCAGPTACLELAGLRAQIWPAAHFSLLSNATCSHAYQVFDE
jgi:hypothetical protein